MTSRWNALILAAGRGRDDPVAKAHGVARKSEVRVDGMPMLKRVAATLYVHRSIGDVVVSIEDELDMRQTLGGIGALYAPSAQTAPSSVLAAVEAGQAELPLIVTTADHPLLNEAIVDYFLKQADASDADLCVALASEKVILEAYPRSKRTYFRLGPDHVSGCNLFALKSMGALKAIKLWQSLDKVRKRPWRLVSAFGPVALWCFVMGRLDLETAFELASRKLKIKVKPIMMPFAEAAIDVDKPDDLELAEAILKARRARG